MNILGTRGDAQDPNIHDVIVELYLGIFLGWFCTTFRILKSEEGHIEGISFYAGKIALPIVIFRDIITMQIANVEMAVVICCFLAKVFVAFITWILAFLMYERKQDRAQRLQNAIIFAFFTTSSNDFLIGYPLFHALFKSSYAETSVCLTMNAILNVTVFVPVTVVLLEVTSPHGQDDASRRKKQIRIFSNTVTNPLFCAALVGMVVRYLHNGAALPILLDDGLKTLAQPFTMLALFMTGASVTSLRISVWAAQLALMKVVVCALVSWGLTRCFFGVIALPTSQVDVLGTFTFFYSSLPTSSAPLVLAKISGLSGSTNHILATGILLCLLMAFPQMLVGVVWISPDTGDGTINTLLWCMTILSAACSLFTLMALMQTFWTAIPGVSMLQNVTALTKGPRLAFRSVLCHVSFVALYHSLGCSLLVFGCQKWLKLMHAVMQGLCHYFPLLLVFFHAHLWEMNTWHLRAAVMIVFTGSVSTGIYLGAFGEPTMCHLAFDDRIAYFQIVLSALVAIVCVLMAIGCNKHFRKLPRENGLELAHSGSIGSTDQDATDTGDENVFDSKQYVHATSIVVFVLSMLECINMSCFSLGGVEFTVLLMAEICIDCGQGVVVFLSLTHAEDLKKLMMDVKKLMMDLFDTGSGRQNIFGTHDARLDQEPSHPYRSSGLSLSSPLLEKQKSCPCQEVA